jgi:hypothetical protein
MTGMETNITFRNSSLIERIRARDKISPLGLEATLLQDQLGTLIPTMQTCPVGRRATTNHCDLAEVQKAMSQDNLKSVLCQICQLSRYRLPEQTPFALISPADCFEGKLNFRHVQ